MGDKLCSSERLPCPVGARSCRCFQGSMVQSPGEPGADAKQGRAHGSSLLTSSGQTVGVISFRDTCDRTSIVGAGGKSFTTPHHSCHVHCCEGACIQRATLGLLGPLTAPHFGSKGQGDAGAAAVTGVLYRCRIRYGRDRT